MKLYLICNDPISSVKYYKLTEEISLTISNNSNGVYVDIPDEDLTEQINVIINNTWTIPVVLSDSSWLDEIDINAFIEDNTYVAKVNKRASEYVRYKDLYKILKRFTSDTINRIHDVLGY